MNKLEGFEHFTTHHCVTGSQRHIYAFHGYTISDARGEGSRGVRSAGWEASSNIRVEVVCDDSIATKVSAHLRKYYYDHYAMILFVSDVGVLRPEKF